MELYHYTSIDVLALILKNRTIRFNSLNNVDDAEEKQTDDIGDFGNSVLVSCWTKESMENIPLWKMYSSDFCGCRIQMNETMFGFDLERLKQGNKFIILNTLESYNLLMVDSTFLRDIVYVDTFSERRIISGAYTLGVLGREKSKVWEFQKECRFYIHQLLDYEAIKSVTDGEIEGINLNERLKHNHFDLNLNEDALNNVKVLLGPKCNEGHISIVEALLERYTTNGKYELSRLTGKI